MDDWARLTFERGRVVLVDLDPTLGHQQQGRRPCVVVSDPAVNADHRFPVIAVIPVTGTLGEGALYPSLAPGPSGLVKTSCALVDHLRAIDKRRVTRAFGHISADELANIDDAVKLYLGLS